MDILSDKIRKFNLQRLDSTSDEYNFIMGFFVRSTEASSRLKLW